MKKKENKHFYSNKYFLISVITISFVLMITAIFLFSPDSPVGFAKYQIVKPTDGIYSAILVNGDYTLPVVLQVQKNKLKLETYDGTVIGMFEGYFNMRGDLKPIDKVGLEDFNVKKINSFEKNRVNLDMDNYNLVFNYLTDFGTGLSYEDSFFDNEGAMGAIFGDFNLDRGMSITEEFDNWMMRGKTGIGGYSEPGFGNSGLYNGGKGFLSGSMGSEFGIVTSNKHGINRGFTGGGEVGQSCGDTHCVLYSKEMDGKRGKARVYGKNGETVVEGIINIYDGEAYIYDEDTNGDFEVIEIIEIFEEKEDGDEDEPDDKPISYGNPEDDDQGPGTIVGISDPINDDGPGLPFGLASYDNPIDGGPGLPFSLTVGTPDSPDGDPGGNVFVPVLSEKSLVFTPSAARSVVVAALSSYSAINVYSEKTGSFTESGELSLTDEASNLCVCYKDTLQSEQSAKK